MEPSESREEYPNPPHVPRWDWVVIGSHHLFPQKNRTLREYQVNWCAQEGAEVHARGKFTKIVVGASRFDEETEETRKPLRGYARNVIGRGQVLIVVSRTYKEAPTRVRLP